MTANGNGRSLRVALDASVILALLSLAYWVGTQSQRIDGLSRRGGVQISMEADSRLTALEGKVERLEHAAR